MDDEEPDHGYGGPAGCGVGFPGGLVTCDYDSDDHVADEDQSVSQILVERERIAGWDWDGTHHVAIPMAPTVRMGLRPSLSI